MDNKTLKEIQAKLETAAAEIRINAAYVEGKNDYILNQVKPKKKPDHRIPVGLAKMAVDDMSGYAGREGNRKTIIKKADAEDNETDNFIDYVKKMEEYNKESIETAELYQEALGQGKAYEIFWTSDGADLPGGLLTCEYKIVPTESVYIVWTDDIKPKMEAFIYFSGDKKLMTASVYYPVYREDWVSKDGGKYEFSGEIVEYPFTEPPLNIFPINRQQKPIFEAGKPLINEYDLVTSRALNEVDRFNDSIIVIKEKANQAFKEALSEGDITVIDQQGDDTGLSGSQTDLPRYLNKNYTGIAEMYRDIRQQAYTDFRKVIKVYDVGVDEASGGQVSGASQAYKMLGMEFMASKIDTYFNQGIEKRFDFYVQAYNAGTNKINPNDYKVEIKADRNLPVNIVEIVEMLIQIWDRGLLSEETILENMPKQLVKDVKKELERLKKQRAEREPKDVLGLGGNIDAPTDAGSEQEED